MKMGDLMMVVNEIYLFAKEARGSQGNIIINHNNHKQSAAYQNSIEHSVFSNYIRKFKPKIATNSNAFNLKIFMFPKRIN